MRGHGASGPQYFRDDVPDGLDNDCDGGPGPCVLDSDIGLSDADVTFVGGGSPTDVGRTVATGDVNGDGIGDILVGARQADPDGTAVGAAYLVYGVGL